MLFSLAISSMPSILVYFRTIFMRRISAALLDHQFTSYCLQFPFDILFNHSHLIWYFMYLPSNVTKLIIDVLLRATFSIQTPPIINIILLGEFSSHDPWHVTDLDQLFGSRTAFHVVGVRQLFCPTCI